jgi:hypothetical protein
MNRRAWLAVGVLGLIACAISAWLELPELMQAYLLAWLFFMGLTLGSLGSLMLYELTGGQWGQPVRDRFKAAVAPLPLLVVLFIPVIIGMSHLFPWAQDPPPHGTGDKSWYLNKDFFVIRAAIILLSWLLLAWWWRRGRRRTAACSVGLIVYFVTMTVAAVDWIGSLQPRWYSTVFGMIVITGQGLGAFAFAVTTTAFARPARGMTATQCGDLGNLLLTFLMTWMYLAFIQLLIIWSEDLPRETVWYLPRLQTSWRYLAIALVIAEFAIPFALLLFRSLKRDPRTLAYIAALMLLAHWLDVGWYVIPSLHPTGLTFYWVDLAATVGIGGLWMARWARRAEQLEVADGPAR